MSETFSFSLFVKLQQGCDTVTNQRNGRRQSGCHFSGREKRRTVKHWRGRQEYIFMFYLLYKFDIAIVTRHMGHRLQSCASDGLLVCFSIPVSRPLARLPDSM